MKEIFCERTVTYNLRNNNEFLLPRVRTTSYGSETIKYRGQRLWVSLPQHIRDAQSIIEFKKQIKAGMALTAHVGYVGLSYHNLDFCNTITYQTQNFGF